VLFVLAVESVAEVRAVELQQTLSTGQPRAEVSQLALCEGGGEGTE